MVSRSSTLERPQIAVAGFACARCNHFIETPSKFCGNCGEPAAMMSRSHTQLQSTFNHQSQMQQMQLQLERQAQGQTGAFMASNLANKQAEDFYSSHQPSTPSFAVPKRKNKPIPPEIREEMASINATMLRERFFLIFHYSVFLVTNLIGFAMAIKCYAEYIGDDVTRTMIATTPLLFINLVALCCLVPIKGTKGEIARLKDRMTNLKLRLEFDSII
ncbi:MAG: hypothetical protein JSS86_13620 [Cyanobacteria bacterium SZAS LIN-2]|nr:hypothetical protein [Cyanobacteria bacterium SZAS LIN-3]MBS1997352.1 hypothetical protein [Cyanobacteria bacterium SZAS LIN-2]